MLYWHEVCGYHEEFSSFLVHACLITSTSQMYNTHIVDNKAKGWISKLVFQENKALQIFRKNEHFLPPDTLTYVCVSGGKKCSFLRKIWRALFSWNTRFEIHPFLPYYRRYELRESGSLINLDWKSVYKNFLK